MADTPYDTPDDTPELGFKEPFVTGCAVISLDNTPRPVVAHLSP